MTKINLTLSAVVLASGSLVLAGCGGSSSSPGVAHLSSSGSGGSPSSGGGSSSPESRESSQRKLVAFARCMRAHGVAEFPEPTEGRLLVQGGSQNGHTSGLNPRSAQFQTASKACQKLAPNGGKPNPQLVKQAQERSLKFSQCMRAHGVPNFPDPTFSGGGVSLTLKAGGAGAIDPNSSQFKAGQKACLQYFGPPGSKGGGGVALALPPGGPGGGGSSQESKAAP
jgi:hypothetical protein